MSSLTAKKSLLSSATLEGELKNIDYCFNVAKNRYSFSKSYRTRAAIALLFGLRSHDGYFSSRKISSIKEIEIFHDQLKQIVKEKYENRKQLPVWKEQQNQSNVLASTEMEIIVPERWKEEQSESDESADDQQDDSVYRDKFPDQVVELLRQSKDGCNQVKAAKALFDNLWYKEYRSQTLLAQTGAGKTYVLGSIIKNFIANGGIKKCNCISPWPILYVTKSSIVEQTRKVLSKEFSLDCINTVHVINIEFLRTEVGSLFVKEDIVIVNGEETTIYKWNSNLSPCLFLWDECQILTREISIQSQIAHDVGRIEDRNPQKKIFQVFASATPYTRVIEARCFAVGTRIEFKLGVGKVKLTDAVWKQFADMIAHPSDPYEYCEAAIKRFVDFMDPYIVRIKNIRPKHKAINSTMKIHFRNDEERERYETIIARYLEEKAKIENDDSIKNKGIAVLAQFTVLRKGAEEIRVPVVADWIVDMWNKGYQPVLAACFKRTISGITRRLIEHYGWSREDISIIWGGATETLSAKNKLKKKIKGNQAFLDMLEKEDIDLEEIGIKLDDFEEKTEEQLAFEKLHGLLSQKPEEREKERIRFQKGEARCCLFSFKSGGVGLSLHHEAIYSKARPRIVLLTPVYSEKELVQGLGRCPRITSASDTSQYMCYYNGTIEEHVAARVKQKLRCLKNVVKIKESWEDIVIGKMKEMEEFKETTDAVDEIEGNQLMDYKDEESDSEDKK